MNLNQAVYVLGIIVILSALACLAVRFFRNARKARELTQKLAIKNAVWRVQALRERQLQKESK